MKTTKRTTTAIVFSIIIVAVAIAATLFRRSNSEKPVAALGGTALGTFYNITLVGALPEGLQGSLDSLFTAANASMSVFDENSTLSRINRGETDMADPYILRCLTIAERVSRLSGGLYDVTVAPLSRALGFGRGEAVENPNIDSILQFVGYQKLTVQGDRIIKADQRIEIDLNSVAKGAVVDMAAALVESYGIENYLVDIGGEIFCRGKNSRGERWTVGVETPFEGNYSVSGEYIETTVRLSGRGLATSGNYRNFRTDSAGRKYTHIINPLTGENTQSNLLSATVIADDCATADALGTMCMAVGLEGSQAIAAAEDLAVLLIYADRDGSMKIWRSEAMRAYTD